MEQPPEQPERESTPLETGRDDRGGNYAALLIVVLVIAYFIAFIVQNTNTAKVHWVFGTSNSSVIWLIFVTLVIGIALGLLLSYLYRRRRRRSPDEGT